MDINNVIFAFVLTLFAGLSTGIGSILAFFTKRTNTKFLSAALGFSAGVMIYVSMIEIFFEAKLSLVKALGVTGGSWATIGAFFGGIFLIAIIDRLVPSFGNPHEMRMVEAVENTDSKIDSSKLMRLGLFTAIAIAIHNFPEGLATVTTAISNPSLGIAIAAAIAIHNIPEGIAVSIPIYYATGDKRKAFKLSFLSGLSEPLGALAGYLILMQFYSDAIFGVVMAAVAGIMVFISLDELLPTAREYGEAHLSIYGLIAGMMVMAVSLLLFI
ncbi:MAG: putative divalent heavy-metal cations transporter [Clostridia bacterium]|jgi:ZIP family zinc transporter|nr:putative divalent heavy-metal cations transporter [Clostridia bacterium]